MEAGQQSCLNLVKSEGLRDSLSAKFELEHASFALMAGQCKAHKVILSNDASAGCCADFQHELLAGVFRLSHLS